MKIREVKLNKFKRFTDLTITDIPDTAKLVVLVGPNGCGKTSVFEGLNHWYKWNGFTTVQRNFPIGSADRHWSNSGAPAKICVKNNVVTRKMTGFGYICEINK